MNKSYQKFLKQAEKITYENSLELFDIIIEILKESTPNDAKDLINKLIDLHNDIVKTEKNRIYSEGYNDGAEDMTRRYKDLITSTIDYHYSSRNHKIKKSERALRNRAIHKKRYL